MPLLIDSFNKLVLVTSPTTSVDAQTLADFIEDFMATPVGLLTDGVWPGFAGQGDIQDPQGKIEDPSQPGVFSQIILKIHPEWQIQFWGGSGYTRIFGGKLVGGVGDQPMKATGTAGDITVLESPVDGLAIATGGSGLSAGEALQLQDLHKLLGLNKAVKITITPAGIDSDDGDIDINFTGDGISSTVMDRQP